MTAQPLSREDLPPQPTVKKTAAKTATATKRSAKSSAKSGTKNSTQTGTETSAKATKSSAKTVAKTATTRQRAATKAIVDFPLPDNVQTLPVQTLPVQTLPVQTLPVQTLPVQTSVPVDRQILTTIDALLTTLDHSMQDLGSIVRQMDALERPNLDWVPIDIKISDRAVPPVAAASPNYWGGNVKRPESHRSRSAELPPELPVELPPVPAAPVLHRVSQRNQPIAAKPTLIRTSSSRPIPPLYGYGQDLPQPTPKPGYGGGHDELGHGEPCPCVPRSYPKRLRTTTRNTRYTLTYFYQLFQQLLPIPTQPSAILFDAAMWTIGSVGVHVAFQILIKIIPALSFPLHLVMLFPALFAAYLAFCVPKSSTPFVYRCLLITLGFFFGSKL
jgi:hypothetical protein